MIQKKKIGRRPEWYLTKQETKHRKRHSISFDIREVQIKTTGDSTTLFIKNG